MFLSPYPYPLPLTPEEVAGEDLLPRHDLPLDGFIQKLVRIQAYLVFLRLYAGADE